MHDARRVTAGSQGHWDGVYARTGGTTVSWYQAGPGMSLAQLERAAVPATAAVLDVGGGTSTLVDTLLARGFVDVTVLDLSAVALSTARDRLGEAAARVHWCLGDVLDWHPNRRFDVWHDRALFHFLTALADRDAYRSTLRRALRRGGLAVVATFAEDGPDRCSGLLTARYSADALAAEFGDEFVEVAREREEHRTPAGVVQPFTWLVLRRTDTDAFGPEKGPPAR
jgi:SAM-dependent methyltransferase